MISRKAESFRRRIKALEEMYVYDGQKKAFKNDVVWDLICDIILTPETLLSECEKGELLYRLATGEEREAAND